MTDAAFHSSEEFIDEDLEYYFSGERDKNNQIRPDENIYSLTPTAKHLSVCLDDNKVGNFFYPTLPYLLDRIYIGISVPLFASNWGASFLLELLKIIKPGGTVILPVYPERQAQEKGYWSRSFLENIFLSRQRWTGFSNVRAENDGVMSLRVGRKWPDPIPSTAQWFYQQRANLALEKSLQIGKPDEIENDFCETAIRVWANNTHSSVVERIVLDHYGAKHPVSVNCLSNDYGLLLTDLLLSPYITVTSGHTQHVAEANDTVIRNFASYFAPYIQGQHTFSIENIEQATFTSNVDVVCLIHVLANLPEAQQWRLIENSWAKVNQNGLLIIHDAMPEGWKHNDVHKKLASLGNLSTYSSIVASKLEENVEISHYSRIQEAKLRDEKQHQKTVFKVIQKI